MIRRYKGQKKHIKVVLMRQTFERMVVNREYIPDLENRSAFVDQAINEKIDREFSSKASEDACLKAIGNIKK